MSTCARRRGNQQSDIEEGWFSIHYRIDSSIRYLIAWNSIININSIIPPPPTLCFSTRYLLLSRIIHFHSRLPLECELSEILSKLITLIDGLSLVIHNILQYINKFVIYKLTRFVPIYFLRTKKKKKKQRNRVAFSSLLFPSDDRTKI